MLRSNASFIRFLVMTADLLLLGLAFAVTFGARYYRWPLDGEQSLQLLRLFAVGLPVWHVLLRVNGAYQSLRMRSLTSLIQQIGSAAVWFALLQFAMFYLVREAPSRIVMVLYPVLGFVFLASFRLFGMAILSRLRRGGFNYRNILFVGAGQAGIDYLKRVRQNLGWGIRLRGLLTCGTNEFDPSLFGVPVIGTSDDLQRFLLTEPIDRVVFSPPKEELDLLPDMLAICEELGVEAVVMPPAFQRLQTARIHVEDFFGQPVINYTTTPRQSGQLVLKRIIDVTASSVVLILLSPLFLGLAIAIRLESPGPVFFKQARSGVRGRRFNCYKFRSMYIDAEERLAELQGHNEMSGPVFKMKNDPRVTKTGAFIRRYSLDEFPQFFNVFRGEMSLVGPRPPLPCEVAEYAPWQRRRLSMKPGLTCTWQVSGRNDIDFEQWMKLDLEYIDNWTLALDIKLLLKTIPAVVRGTGV